jgi:hypothetical protein
MTVRDRWGILYRPALICVDLALIMLDNLRYPRAK